MSRLTERQVAIRDMTREFVRNEVTPFAAQWDRDATVPLDTLRKIGALGLFGVIIRRNVLVIYMSLELMLNAANLALVAFSRFSPFPNTATASNLDGQIFVFFVITVAAAEALPPVPVALAV